jgi:DNA polymerase IIIc chi subunit
MEKPRVLVHRLAGNKKALDACRLIEKLYLAGERVVVWFADEGKAAIFDTYLWTFSDTSFVPHKVALEGAKVSEPVALVIGRLHNPNEASQLVVMERPKNLKEAAAFARVHDLWLASEDARQEWEKAGFEVEEVRGVEGSPGQRPK